MRTREIQLSVFFVYMHPWGFCCDFCILWDLTKHKKNRKLNLQGELLCGRMDRRFCAALIRPCLEKSSVTQRLLWEERILFSAMSRTGGLQWLTWGLAVWLGWFGKLMARKLSFVATWSCLCLDHFCCYLQVLVTIWYIYILVNKFPFRKSWMLRK